MQLLLVPLLGHDRAKRLLEALDVRAGAIDERGDIRLGHRNVRRQDDERRGKTGPTGLKSAHARRR